MPEDPSFFIFIERLKKGAEEAIDAEFSPNFLGMDKKAFQKEGLFFDHPVNVKGKAYLAGETLIVEIKWNVVATIPCSICNEPVNVTMSQDHVVFTTELDEVKGSKYSFSEPLRESILLEAPSFAECLGKCPVRKEVEKYLKESSSNEKEDRYHPFENL